MSTNSGHSDINLTRSINAMVTTTGFIGDQSVSSRVELITFHQYTHPGFNTTWDMPIRSISFLDSPNTTSSIVYQLVQFLILQLIRYILIDRLQKQTLLILPKI